MSHPVTWDEGPYLPEDDDACRWYAEVGCQREREELSVKELTRLAYAEPEKAGLIAKEQGVYQDFISHMLAVHARLRRFYASSD